MRHSALLGLALALVTATSCGSEPAPRTRLALTVAPLDLPGVAAATYDVTIEYLDGEGAWRPTASIDGLNGDVLTLQNTLLASLGESDFIFI